MIDEDAELRDLLRTLSRSARDHLRDVLIRDHADQDAIAWQLLRSGEAASRISRSRSVTRQAEPNIDREPAVGFEPTTYRLQV